ETFQAFVSTLTELALGTEGDVDALKAAAYPGTGRTVAEEITHLIATIGENMGVRRVAHVTVPVGVVASYVHNAAAPGLGKIGVIVGLQTEGDAEQATALGRQIAMHIAAARPEAVSVDEVDASALDRERDVLTEQARASGKPENIIAKMVEGRLRKYYEEVVLLEQVWVIDGETKVGKVLEAAAKDLGGPVTVTGFARFNLGEGIDKGESDFAAEVQATLGG
ncbi:MAG: translation elongation factor Ts, partial [Rhodospirillaceae bacterium]|nr:translation elongation factor Ts [Rhodospirillaceae bacterium]